MLSWVLLLHSAASMVCGIIMLQTRRYRHGSGHPVGLPMKSSQTALCTSGKIGTDSHSRVFMMLATAASVSMGCWGGGGGERDGERERERERERESASFVFYVCLSNLLSAV